MTRVNIVPVEELYDQHLIAEYRELLMIPGSLQRTLNSKQGFVKKKVPKQFTLNKGHVYFFYDKGLYLDKRYSSLVAEMRRRGFAPDPSRTFPREVFPYELYNDWTPTSNGLELARDRIKARVALKPNWYRKTEPHEILKEI